MNRQLTLVGPANGYREVVLNWLSDRFPEIERRARVKVQGHHILLDLACADYGKICAALQSDEEPEHLFCFVLPPENDYQMPRFIRGKAYRSVGSQELAASPAS